MITLVRPIIPSCQQMRRLQAAMKSDMKCVDLNINGGPTLTRVCPVA